MFYVIEFDDGEVDFIESDDYSEALHLVESVSEGRECTISEYDIEPQQFYIKGE